MSGNSIDLVADYLYIYDTLSFFLNFLSLAILLNPSLLNTKGTCIFYAEVIKELY